MVNVLVFKNGELKNNWVTDEKAGVDLFVDLCKQYIKDFTEEMKAKALLEEHIAADGYELFYSVPVVVKKTGIF